MNYTSSTIVVIVTPPPTYKNLLMHGPEIDYSSESKSFEVTSHTVEISPRYPNLHSCYSEKKPV